MLPSPLMLAVGDHPRQPAGYAVATGVSERPARNHGSIASGSRGLGDDLEGFVDREMSECI